MFAGSFKGTRNFAACNHLRSYKYYTESITSKDGFFGIPCNNYDDFTAVSYLFEFLLIIA